MNEVTVIENTAVVAESNPVQILTMISGLVQRDSFDIDALEKLIKLQNDEEDRQAKRAFNLALSEMLGEIPVIAKTGVNTFNNTKFMKLEDVIEITRPILHKYGFSVTYKQNRVMSDNIKSEAGHVFCMMTIICILKHKDGHEELTDTELPIATIKGQTPIQAMGMGSTYGRRYTLMQALNIATGESDNDGFSVNAKAEAKRRTLDEAAFVKAIKMINDKTYTVEKLLDKCDLTSEQTLRLGREVVGE